jgi:hypothetical protein
VGFIVGVFAMLGHLVAKPYNVELQSPKSDAAVDFFARIFRALFRRK